MATFGLRVNQLGGGGDIGLGKLLGNAAGALWGDAETEIKLAQLRNDVATGDYQRRKLEAEAAYAAAQQRKVDYETNIRQELGPEQGKFLSSLVEDAPAPVEVEPSIYVSPMAIRPAAISDNTIAPVEIEQDIPDMTQLPEDPVAVEPFYKPAVMDQTPEEYAAAQAAVERERIARQQLGELAVAGGGSASDIVSGLGKAEGIVRLGSEDPEQRRRGDILYSGSVEAGSAEDHFGPVVTGEAATKLGLDPNQSWQMNTVTEKWESVGKDRQKAPETYGPVVKGKTVPGTENLDPDLSYQLNKTTGKYEQVATANDKNHFGPVVTGEEAEALGLDPVNSYQQNTETKQWDQIGGKGTTVNVAGETDPLNKAMAENDAKNYAEYSDQGIKAQNMKNDMAVMKELIKVAPQGGLPGMIASLYPAGSKAGAVFQSIVERLAPTMRVVGSGSTSDIEYLGMLKSLPRLVNDPVANQLIAAMVEAKANIDIQRAEIINQYRIDQTDPDPAKRAASKRAFLTGMNDVMRQSTMTPELRRMIKGVGGDVERDGRAALRASQGEGGGETAAPGAPVQHEDGSISGVYTDGEGNEVPYTFTPGGG